MSSVSLIDYLIEMYKWVREAVHVESKNLKMMFNCNRMDRIVRMVVMPRY